MPVRPAIILFLVTALFSGCAHTVDYSLSSDADLKKSAEACTKIIMEEADPDLRGPVFPSLFGNQSELVKMGRRAVPTVVAALVKADGWKCRRHFVNVLGAIGGNAAITELEGRINTDGKVQVKDECAIALGRLGRDSALRRLTYIVKSKRKPIVRRARAVVTLARFEGNAEVENVLVGLLDVKTPVMLSQVVLSGFWPLRWHTWSAEEVEFCEFVLAALVCVTSENYGYTRGDGKKARAAATDAWKKRAAE